MKMIIYQLVQSVLYLQNQQKKKETKEPFDSVEWDPIVELSSKKTVPEEEKRKAI